jgi:hypothetical protein
MPAYDWCCLSCGEPNDRRSNACVACGCSASATIASLVDHRRRFVASGGTLKERATTLHKPPELSAWLVLGAVVALLFGVWPFQDSKPKREIRVSTLGAAGENGV